MTLFKEDTGHTYVYLSVMRRLLGLCSVVLLLVGWEEQVVAVRIGDDHHLQHYVLDQTQADSAAVLLWKERIPHNTVTLYKTRGNEFTDHGVLGVN